MQKYNPILFHIPLLQLKCGYSGVVCTKVSCLLLPMPKLFTTYTNTYLHTDEHQIVRQHTCVASVRGLYTTTTTYNVIIVDTNSYYFLIFIQTFEEICYEKINRNLINCPLILVYLFPSVNGLFVQLLNYKLWSNLYPLWLLFSYYSMFSLCFSIN